MDRAPVWPDKLSPLFRKPMVINNLLISLEIFTIIVFSDEAWDICCP
jgi:hypothetical protein